MYKIFVVDEVVGCLFADMNLRYENTYLIPMVTHPFGMTIENLSDPCIFRRLAELER